MKIKIYIFLGTLFFYLFSYAEIKEIPIMTDDIEYTGKESEFIPAEKENEINEDSTSSQQTTYIESKNSEDEDIIEDPKIDYNQEDLKLSNTESVNNDLKDSSKEQNNKDDRFEEINDRTNRITALGSAMGAVDLSKTPHKKIRIGAGVGHSSNSQAVAVGVGYAPTERLKLNTKFSTSTTSTKSSSIAVGASYELDW